MMGRPRSERWSWLPRYCYPDRGRIVYRAPGLKPVRLCSEAEATYDLVVRQLAEHIEKLPDTSTLRWLCDQYLESEQFKSLSAGTRRGYRNYYNTLTNFKGKGGMVMGDAPFAKITPGLLRKYLDKRAKQKAPVAGNREVKGFLSAVYSWAGEREMLPAGMANPCHGVSRNKEAAGTRYIEDWELHYAWSRAELITAPFMRLAYLLAARTTEVLQLRRDDLTPDGVRVRRLKGSRTNVVAWSPALEEAVNAALGLPGAISSFYLLHDDEGQPITYSALRCAWDRMMDRCVADAVDDGLVWTRFTRHHLKHKGASDHKDGRVAGHKTEQMRTRYRVREEIEEPVR